MNPIKTVLVGAGRWGENIARSLKDLERWGLVELSYVVDINFSRALELSRKYGFREAKSSIDEASGEAFIIATPIDTLYRSALKAMDRASCVFIEKPAAENHAEAAELLAIAEARGVTHQVGFLSRFDPAVVRLREQVGGAGVYALRFRRLSRRPPQMRGYPVTLDLMSHDVDLAYYLLGANEAQAKFSLFVLEDGVPQRAVAGLTFGGVDVVFEADGVLPVKIREVDALTNRGIVRADLVSRRLAVVTESGTTWMEAGNGEPLKEELRVFAERCCCRDMEAPDLEDAVAVLRVIDELSRVAIKIPP